MWYQSSLENFLLWWRNKDCIHTLHDILFTKCTHCVLLQQVQLFGLRAAVFVGVVFPSIPPLLEESLIIVAFFSSRIVERICEWNEKISFSHTYHIGNSGMGVLHYSFTWVFSIINAFLYREKDTALWI